MKRIGVGVTQTDPAVLRGDRMQKNGAPFCIVRPGKKKKVKVIVFLRNINEADEGKNKKNTTSSTPVPLKYGSEVNLALFDHASQQKIVENVKDAGEPATRDEVENAIAKFGLSCQVMHPQRFDGEVAGFLAALEDEFGCLFGANSYVTPAGCVGFAPHFDDVEVWMLQLEGKKRWRCWTVNDKETFYAPGGGAGGAEEDNVNGSGTNASSKGGSTEPLTDQMGSDFATMRLPPASATGDTSGSAAKQLVEVDMEEGKDGDEAADDMAEHEEEEEEEDDSGALCDDDSMGIADTDEFPAVGANGEGEGGTSDDEGVDGDGSECEDNADLPFPPPEVPEAAIRVRFTRTAQRSARCARDTDPETGEQQLLLLFPHRNLAELHMCGEAKLLEYYESQLDGEMADPRGSVRLEEMFFPALQFLMEKSTIDPALEAIGKEAKGCGLGELPLAEACDRRALGELLHTLKLVEVDLIDPDEEDMDDDEEESSRGAKLKEANA
eukprot:g1591.t1